MFPEVAEVLGKVCEHPRGLFRKRSNIICEIFFVCFLPNVRYLLDDLVHQFVHKPATVFVKGLAMGASTLHMI